MTEQNPEPPDSERDLGPEPAPLPRWVPVMIAALLVVIAGLAVFTGLHYRNGETLVGMMKHTERQPRSASSAPPGEPGAGGSLVVPDSVPAANAPVTGAARAEVTGGPNGVTSTVRIWARRGMVLNVLPEDAMVYVNDTPIGEVRQFNSMDEVYDFAEPGSYNVRLVAPGYRESRYIVTAAEDAKQDIVRITAKLARE
jgi:hypothetical protein